MDVGPQELGVAHERGHEPGRRRLEDAVRRVRLLDPPALHDDHPVADGQRLGLVVGDEDRGGAGLAEHAHELGPDLARGGSRRARRTARRGGPRPAGARGPAPAPRAAARRRTARAGSGRPVGPAAPGRAPRRTRAPARSAAAWPSPKRDVARDRQVREQRVVLEHQPDPAPLGLHEPAARAGDLLAGDRTEPASGRSSPATSRSTVDLPQPEGPISVTISPGARRGRGRRAATPAPYALATPARRETDRRQERLHGPGRRPGVGGAHLPEQEHTPGSAPSR